MSVRPPATGGLTLFSLSHNPSQKEMLKAKKY